MVQPPGDRPTRIRALEGAQEKDAEAAPASRQDAKINADSVPVVDTTG